ncbi:unnamed protein product [Peronospora effusa]|nr:unnamed protein product [Peronospora effusa]
MDRTANKIFWSNEVVEKTLHSMGLPASIEAFEKTSDNGIPRTIWRRIQLVKVIAGSTRTEIGESRDNPIVAFIQHQLQENQRMLDDGEKKLYLIKSRLSQEQAEDDVCRQNYGEKKWARPLSSSFNRKFRADMYRCFSLVREAKTSDRTARDKLNENQDKLEALSRDKASLDHELPELQQNNFSCKEEIACVSSLFSQLERHMQEKHHVLYDFRQSYNNFDALPELLSGKNAGAVFTDTAFEIEKQSLCDEFERRISSICKLERYMLKEIVKANARFEAKKEISHVLRERQTFLQYLNDGADVFEQLHSHVEEKTKSYDELSIRIAQLHQTVEDHCSAREFEKRELEMNLAADEEMRQHETEDAALARR